MSSPEPAGDARRSANRRLRAALLAATALALQLLSCHSNVRAQERPTEPPESEEVVSIRADLVVVPFYVTDGRGRRVAGLSKEDFAVRDNGRPVEPSYFVAGAERVGLLFLLDASGSTRDIVTRQSETALALFSRFGARSRVAVMQFRERPEPTVPFTRDLRAARAGFRIAALPDRRTAIFDAARESVRAFKSAADARERRIVVLVSDGLDTASATTPAGVVEEARAAGVS
ncbi:MAG TPA: VWA domain-containing protein, partial [Pyrinomonadaceae bacterium]